MDISPAKEAERTYRYEPPAWARLWEDDRIRLTASSRDPASKNAVITDRLSRPAGEWPMIVDRPGERTASRWTGYASVALVLFALVWFGGHVLIAWAEGKF